MAEEFRHRPSRVAAADEVVGVVAVGADDVVFLPQVPQRADGHGLLAGVEVAEAADAALRVLLGDARLEIARELHPIVGVHQFAFVHATAR